MAARGKENQPEVGKHFAKQNKGKIVLWEQASHRKVSKANGAGYHGNLPGGHDTWQSHHIVCISSTGDRKREDDTIDVLLEESLHITDWNINKADNMIGLPQWRRYRDVFGKIDDKKLKGAAHEAAYAAAQPANLPAHDVDHNCDDGYTDEVTKHLKKEIWNKYDAEEKDHSKNATWLATQLKDASTFFQDRLLERGKRRGNGPRGRIGTVAAWQNRIAKKNKMCWTAPFSMAKKPTQKSPGVSETDLTDIFEASSL